MADLHVAVVEARKAGMPFPKIAEFFGLHKCHCVRLVRLAREKGIEYVRAIRMSKTAGKPRTGLSESEYDAQVLQRIRARTVPGENGCLIWQGFKFQSRGSRSWYGSTNYHAKNWRVHRLVAHLMLRPAKVGEVVMHLCDNSLCVNHEHLAYGSLQENLKDAAAKGSYRYHASHYKACKHGHEFTPENTRICKQGFRHCKQCERNKQLKPEYVAWRREYQRKRRALKRAESVGVQP